MKISWGSNNKIKSIAIIEILMINDGITKLKVGWWNNNKIKSIAIIEILMINDGIIK